ncbi:MAG: MarR family winged helix-turn-helix transcriptional regulator [bacterium]
MSELLSRRLLQTRCEGPHHEALLAGMLANAAIDARLDAVFEGTGITQQQYNVLRILNGVYPGAHSRGEIAHRMVRRAPDLTRMLDRLVRMGYVERMRGEQDHRQSLARITPQGRALLESLLPRVQGTTQMLAARMTAEEARQLAALAERIYAED